MLVDSAIHTWMKAVRVQLTAFTVSTKRKIVTEHAKQSKNIDILAKGYVRYLMKRIKLPNVNLSSKIGHNAYLQK